MPMKLVLMFGLGGHIHRDNHDCKSNWRSSVPNSLSGLGLRLAACVDVCAMSAPHGTSIHRQQSSLRDLKAIGN